MEENNQIKNVTLRKRAIDGRNNVYQEKNKSAAKIILVITILIVIVIGSFFMIKSIGKKSSPADNNSVRSINPGEVIDTDLLNEETPTSSEIITQGRFNSVEQKVTGKALFIENNQERYLRFEEFETINAQNLHVYLSPILNLDKNDAIDLGLLKAISGNFNYQLDKNIDIEKYNNVVIWSDSFEAFFGYASLINKELPPEPEVEITDEEKAQPDAENDPQMPLLDNLDDTEELPQESSTEEIDNQ